MKLYNTLSKKSEEFVPIKDKKVGLYVCGPTVYNFDHLGHARVYLIFDLLKRFLASQGYKVKYVQNITDVGHLMADEETGEDKVEKRAKSEGKSPDEIARFYEEAHIKDLKALNIELPDISPRASAHIPDIVRHIQLLIDKGFAYQVSGNVYFDIRRFNDYGKLSGRNFDQMLKNVRIEKDPNKRYFADFALWKKADPSHIQKWPSPWGQGYPGWHIECSVMSTKYLGQPFDIHGAATELIFPHHENEIAQSQAAYNKPYVNFFIHVGMVTTEGHKMAKSKGNVIWIHDLIKQYPVDVIRLAIFQTNWRRPFDYKKNVFEEAQVRWQKILQAKAQAKKTGENQNFRQEFNNALNNDLNTPQALTVLDKYISKLFISDFEFLQKILGLKLEFPKIKLTDEQNQQISRREQLRKEGKFDQADEIRKMLEQEGIIIQDTEKGSQVLTKI